MKMIVKLNRRFWFANGGLFEGQLLGFIGYAIGEDFKTLTRMDHLSLSRGSLPCLVYLENFFLGFIWNVFLVWYIYILETKCCGSFIYKRSNNQAAVDDKFISAGLVSCQFYDKKCVSRSNECDENLRCVTFDQVRMEVVMLGFSIFRFSGGLNFGIFLRVLFGK